MAHLRKQMARKVQNNQFAGGMERQCDMTPAETPLVLDQRITPPSPSGENTSSGFVTDITSLTKNPDASSITQSNQHDGTDSKEEFDDSDEEYWTFSYDVDEQVDRKNSLPNSKPLDTSVASHIRPDQKPLTATSIDISPIPPPLPSAIPMFSTPRLHPRVKISSSKKNRSAKGFHRVLPSRLPSLSAWNQLISTSLIGSQIEKHSEISCAMESSSFADPSDHLNQSPPGQINQQQDVTDGTPPHINQSANAHPVPQSKAQVPPNFQMDLTTVAMTTLQNAYSCSDPVKARASLEMLAQVVYGMEQCGADNLTEFAECMLLKQTQLQSQARPSNKP